MKCGSSVYQGPEGAPFKVFYPRYFAGYSAGKSNKLPKYCQPSKHINYENRMWDWNDGLPKYAGFGPGDLLNNDGTPKQE